MGVRGAALATVIGTIVASVMCIISLFDKDSYMNFITMAKSDCKFSVEIANEIKT